MMAGKSGIDRKLMEGTIRAHIVSQTESDFAERVVGTRVIGMESKLADLRIRLSNDNVILLAAFSGRIRYHDNRNDLPNRPYLHLVFSDDTHLTVTVSLYACIGAQTPHDIADYGVDPSTAILDPSSTQFTLDRFMSLFTEYPDTAKLSAKRLVTICIPNYIGGIGNAYLQPILYEVGIDPRRRVPTLTDAEKKSYFGAIEKIVSEASKCGGKQSELDLFGNPGAYISPVGKKPWGHPAPDAAQSLNDSATWAAPATSVLDANRQILQHRRNEGRVSRVASASPCAAFRCLTAYITAATILYIGGVP
jgi:formamidopyrimidine-DNA glycosylase